MRPSLALLCLALAALAAGCGDGSSSGGTAAPPRPLDLMLDWTPNPDHVAIFVARHKGYFDAAGLRVRVRVPADPTTPLKLLAAGRIDLAVSYEPELFFAAEKKLPVIAVASIVPQPLDSIISLRPLPSLRALAGRVIGITGVPTDDAFLATILGRAGLARADVKVVHVGYNLLPALLSHNVDAILGGYRNVEGIQLEQRGLHPTIVPVDHGGVPRYAELVVAANADRLRRDRGYADAVRRFVAALARGDRAASADPAAALAAVQESTESPRAFIRRSVPATVALLNDAPCLHLRSWAAFGVWMAARKLLARPVRAGAVVTSAYLPPTCHR